MPERSSDSSIYPPIKNGNGNVVNDRNGSNYLYSSPIVNQTISTEVDNDSLDLRQLTSIVKHRLRLIGIVTFGVTAAAALFTFTKEPIYKGEFKLLVESVTEKQENPLSLLQQDLGGLDYDTQIEVLQSPAVLEPIVETLKNRYPALEYE